MRIRRVVMTTFAIASAASVALTGTGAHGSLSQTRAAERARMVERQVQARDIGDPRVLTAMRTVPRHRFVPDGLQNEAYADSPLPIDRGQTIS